MLWWLSVIIKSEHYRQTSIVSVCVKVHISTNSWKSDFLFISLPHPTLIVVNINNYWLWLGDLFHLNTWFTKPPPKHNDHNYLWLWHLQRISVTNETSWSKCEIYGCIVCPKWGSVETINNLGFCLFDRNKRQKYDPINYHPHYRCVCARFHFH